MFGERELTSGEPADDARHVLEMNFSTTASLRVAGFGGFVRLLSSDLTGLPAAPGIYAVIRESPDPAEFLEESPGGRFKSRNPTVAISTLEGKWIGGCCVIYIGKAKNLRARLAQYRDFGLGKPAGHWGGRYVWQLADADALIVCWKRTPGDPRDEERRLLAEFRATYGRLPFANLVS